MEDAIEWPSLTIVLKQHHHQQQDLSEWEKGFTAVVYQFAYTQRSKCIRNWVKCLYSSPRYCCTSRMVTSSWCAALEGTP